MDWLKCEYMQSHIGKAYQGEVSSITNFGLFVRLNDVFVEGLIHITELGEDYFHFDQPKQKMIGERTGKTFAIGDILDISVAKVDMDLRRIDFSLKNSSKSSNKGKNKSKKNKTEREKLYTKAKETSKKRASSKTEPKQKSKSKAKPKTNAKKKSAGKDPVQKKAPRRSKK